MFVVVIHLQGLEQRERGSGQQSSICVSSEDMDGCVIDRFFFSVYVWVGRLPTQISQ